VDATVLSVIVLLIGLPIWSAVVARHRRIFAKESTYQSAMLGFAAAVAAPIPAVGFGVMAGQKLGPPWDTFFASLPFFVVLAWDGIVLMRAYRAPHGAPRRGFEVEVIKSRSLTAAEPKSSVADTAAKE